MDNMLDQIKRSLESYKGTWREDKGVWEFSTIIAERKAFLSHKKLTYKAKIKIEEETKTVKFTEMLLESGFGLSSGGYDSEISTGLGFKKETYNTIKGPREGNIEEQSRLFGKSYNYSFDYGEIRKKVETLAKENGYSFKYQLIGLN